MAPRPLQIYKLENEEYNIDLKAINSVLDKVGDRRVAIYSINGPLRNGKSFILGFFLKYLNNKGLGDWVNSDLESTFTFRGGSKRETTGIFMWSEPFIIQKNGHEVALLLMDTQGSFDSETTMQENAIVFALSTLLSSLIMFNIKEKVSEETLQFLRYFAGFARLAEKDNEDEPFQKLIFLIRDWQMSDYDYGYYDNQSSIKGKNFKKDFLNVRDSQPKEVQDTHESILSTFSDVGCYLMPHPGPQVARHSNSDASSFDPDFLDQLKEFIPLMFKTQNIIEKKIGGSFVNGNDLKRFVDKWAKIFKSKEMPQSKSVFEATAELQHEMAKAAATDYYSRKMKDIVSSGTNPGLEVNQFEKKHRFIIFNNFRIDRKNNFQAFILFYRQILGECLELYRSYRKLGGKEYEEEYTKRIVKETEDQYQYYEQLNNGNLRIKDAQKKMQDELKKFEKEREENERKFKEIKDENSAEKAKLLGIIEEGNKNIASIKEGYQAEMKTLQEEMAATRRVLNEVRSQPGSK
jgi:atlastin